ncbi:DNA recombination protein RmuC [Fulvivirga sedimenti]|uniref:DNA recombination protein RmuC n=1 Tax=Fulvivirga sedimenti TaxID=2879465 RepID=A0A9X1HYC2_9BACT|nr:DNA recombination protein RmuC [Fulvivirga sedimenti]MCA6078972.1 DNA recombination protein RmuC [Fulvivirga sedimenti]
MDVTLIAIGIVGLLIGGIVAWLWTKNRLSEEVDKERSAAENYRVRYEDALNDLEGMKKEVAGEREKVLDLNRDLSTSEANYRNLEERLKQQKEELENIREKFSLEFKNLANQIFEEKSKKFTEQNRSNIGDLLNPLKERIEKFEEKVERSSKESIQWNTALKEQLNHLKDLNQQVTKEAVNLTKALRGDSKTQGNWGEMQLEAILSKTGLEKDIHYFTEQNFKNEEGRNQRLDFIIRMPDDKYLVLDSKVSLTAYSQYFDTDDENIRKECLQKHMVSINGHIKLLSSKNYQNLYDINQPDYVMMFIANEPALTIALREDPNLYERALENNIVLVSTSTLMATLRTISYIWKQDLQNKNALEIARQAGSLYDKFTAFTDDLVKVGKNLEQTQGNYREAMKKLSEGRGNLVRKAEKLRELGAKTSKNMDNRLIDRAGDEENDDLEE